MSRGNALAAASGGAPDVHERLLPQGADRRSLLAERHVAVGVHDGAQHTGAARHVLLLPFGGIRDPL